LAEYFKLNNIMILKFLKILPLILGMVCFAEVGYLHYMLSFVDIPYLVLGIVLSSLSLFLLRKK